MNGTQHLGKHRKHKKSDAEKIVDAINDLSENLGKWLGKIAESQDEAGLQQKVDELTAQLKSSSDKVEDAMKQDQP